jgi:hypothetical protein
MARIFAGRSNAVARRFFICLKLRRKPPTHPRMRMTIAKMATRLHFPT